MEIKDFSYFIDREKGRPCLVAGNGPSLKNFPFDRFEGVYIVVGSGPTILEGKIKKYYWMNANHIYPAPEHHLKNINKNKDSVFLFADSVRYWFGATYDHGFLKNNIKVPWMAFDERHFNGQKCNVIKPCCRMVDAHPGRLTFQEFFEQHFKVENINRDIGTSVLHSLALAILMGCGPIYIQGVELPLYSKDYIYHRTFCDRFSVYMTLRSWKNRLKGLLTGKEIPSDFQEGIEDTLSNFKKLVNVANRQGVKVYNLSKTSMLNQIEILPYLDPKEVV